MTQTTIPVRTAYADSPVIRVDVVVLTDEAEKAKAALESQRRMRLAQVWTNDDWDGEL